LQQLLVCNAFDPFDRQMEAVPCHCFGARLNPIPADRNEERDTVFSFAYRRFLALGPYIGTRVLD
jgi:hypothetical protein